MRTTFSSNSGCSLFKNVIVLNQLWNTFARHSVCSFKNTIAINPMWTMFPLHSGFFKFALVLNQMWTTFLHVFIAFWLLYILKIALVLNQLWTTPSSIQCEPHPPPQRGILVRRRFLSKEGEKILNWLVSECFLSPPFWLIKNQNIYSIGSQARCEQLQECYSPQCVHTCW